MNNFWKYYNTWKEETAVLSTGQFDNDNFNALCDPSKVSIEELIEGSLEILSKGDDWIVHALDIQFEKWLGSPLFTYTGYVPLDDCCKGWRIVLSMYKTKKFEKITEFFELSNK